MIEKKTPEFSKKRKDKTLTLRSIVVFGRVGHVLNDELNRKRRSRQALNAPVLFALFKLDVRFKHL